MNGARTQERRAAAARTADRVSGSVRRNPVTVAGIVTGALAALVGAATTARMLANDGDGGRSPWLRLVGAFVAAAAAGAVIGRATQRWTWSDDRVTDELLDAELALWDELDLTEA